MTAVQSPPQPELDRYQHLLDEAAKIRGVSLWKDAWKRLKRNWAAIGSLWFLIGVALLAFFTPLLPLQSPQYQLADPVHKFQRPSTSPVQLSDDNPVQQWNNPGPVTRLLLRGRMATFGRWSIPSLCGRDELGRDVLSRICWGARVSITVAIIAALVSLVIGVSYGAIAGYLGGNVDAAMMRIVDVLYSIPFIFVVIFVIMILSEDQTKAALASVGINQVVILYILIGAIYWLTMARVVRGQIISLKHEQFVDAARTIGAGTPRIVFRHLVPNVLGIVIVYLTLTIPSVMLFESFLSFLGLGVQPPDVSWGLLMSDGLKVITPLEVHWWLVLFPGLALALTLFALNFLGDGLRDALDPRMKNR